MPSDKARSSRDQVIASLMEVPGVHRAFPDEKDRIFLVCDSSHPGPEILAAADEVLKQAGLQPDQVKLQLAYPAPPLPTRRARFLGVEVQQMGSGLRVATVRLEWGGEVFTGTAEGEAIAAGEMRSCAQATLQALERVIEGAAHFDLIGIKATRIFDTDLVAVLLRSDQANGRQLIGSSLVSENIHHASALAVLNATNRLLGNFLFVSN